MTARDRLGRALAGFGMTAALLAVPACATDNSAGQDADQVGLVQQPIWGGVDDYDHPAVVSLGALGGFPHCSGTLIAPNLVLTAQHCLRESEGVVDDCEGGSFGMARTGVYVKISTSWYDFNAPVFLANNPRFPPGAGTPCGFDLALIMLDLNVSDINEFHPPRLDRALALRETYTQVGFGMTSQQDQWSAGRRRSRSGLAVDCTGNCGVSSVHETNEWVGASAGCMGDSGGPAIDSEGRVAGVVSRGGDPCEDPKSRTIFASPMAFAGWFREVGAEAAALGGYPPPGWLDDTTPPTIYELCANKCGQVPDGAGGSVECGVCPAGKRCLDNLCVSAEQPAPDGGAGESPGFLEPCSEDGSCETGLTCLQTADPPVCVWACGDGLPPCPDGLVCAPGYQACLRESDGGYLIPETDLAQADAGTDSTEAGPGQEDDQDDDSGGCSIGAAGGSGPPGSTGAAALLLALLLLLRRRREK